MTEREEGYMQQHLCECMIDIADQKLQVVSRTVDNNPVPWPEILVLQAIHGDQAVYDIRPVALAPRGTALQEKERMSLIYGRDAVEGVYSGKSVHMEWFMPGWPVDPSKAKRNLFKKSDRPARVTRLTPESDALDDARI